MQNPTLDLERTKKGILSKSKTRVSIMYIVYYAKPNLRERLLRLAPHGPDEVSHFNETVTADVYLSCRKIKRPNPRVSILPFIRQTQRKPYALSKDN